MARMTVSSTDGDARSPPGAQAPNEGRENKCEQRGNDQRLENFAAEIENSDDRRRDDDAAGECLQCCCRAVCEVTGPRVPRRSPNAGLLVNADAQAQFPGVRCCVDFDRQAVDGASDLVQPRSSWTALRFL